MQALIELTTSENQIVLDPFCGSGTSLLAAAMLNRFYIGIELEKDYYNNAKKRLDEFANDDQANIFSNTLKIKQAELPIISGNSKAV